MAKFDYLMELAGKSEAEIRQDIIAAIDAEAITDKDVVTNRHLQPHLTREYVSEVFGLDSKKTFVKEDGTVKTLDKKSPSYAADLEALMDEGGWKPSPNTGLDRAALLLADGTRPAISMPVLSPKGTTKASNGQGRRSDDTIGSHEDYVRCVRELADENGVFIGVIDRSDGSGTMKVVMKNDEQGNPIRFGFPSAFKARYQDAGICSWRNENSVALLESLGY